jgi:hypothetical protein
MPPPHPAWWVLRLLALLLTLAGGAGRDGDGLTAAPALSPAETAASFCAAVLIRHAAAAVAVYDTAAIGKAAIVAFAASAGGAVTTA